MLNVLRVHPSSVQIKKGSANFENPLKPQQLDGIYGSGIHLYSTGGWLESFFRKNFEVFDNNGFVTSSLNFYHLSSFLNLH